MSKRRDRPYQAGRPKRWLRVKNRKHPAMNRVMRIARAVALDWLWRHESGTYVKFTDSGAALFA